MINSPTPVKENFYTRHLLNSKTGFIQTTAVEEREFSIEWRSIPVKQKMGGISYMLGSAKGNILKDFGEGHSVKAVKPPVLANSFFQS